MKKQQKKKQNQKSKNNVMSVKSENSKTLSAAPNTPESHEAMDP